MSMILSLAFCGMSDSFGLVISILTQLRPAKKNEPLLVQCRLSCLLQQIEKAAWSLFTCFGERRSNSRVD